MACSTLATTPASEAVRSLHIPVLLWFRLIRELRRRGGGRRESGAFLLGSRSGGREAAKRFVCYDDLDSRAFDSGIIRFDSAGFARLWQICRETGLAVVGDVHTHPTEWVDQSLSDQQHPMISETGHVALIVPRFAGAGCWWLEGVGLHEYLGNYRWRNLREQNKFDRVRITLW
jgi:proteasome lid subunit RPN8/RPN11